MGVDAEGEEGEEEAEREYPCPKLVGPDALCGEAMSVFGGCLLYRVCSVSC
jgi:hypothetical protein